MADPRTVPEYVTYIEELLAEARAGRDSCCDPRGKCGSHDAEEHPAARHASTVHLGVGLAMFPETDGQTLTASAAREAYVLGLRVLGIDPEALT